ncbi:MAG: response regulator [Deltaproteobacteria bacterium]|nr:response regulator [Deltaproteobacteria bacterium]
MIDDYGNFRVAVKNMLTFFGVKAIDEAVSGEEAVSKMSDKSYDLVMCDYNLGPGKDGQQVLEEVKYRNYITHSTIFMMITADNSMDKFMGAMEYQPDDYLIKPFTREILEKKVKNLFEKKELLRGVEKAIADGDYERALTMCESEILKKPRNLADFYRLKGEVLFKMGNYEETERFYASIMSMGKLPWAMMGSARVKFATERYEEARDVLEQLIAVNNKVMAAYDFLAVVLKKMGKPLDAQKVLMGAVAISPKEIRRQKELGQLSYDNKDLAIAEKALKAAVRQGKHSCFKSPENFTILANVLIDKGEREEGIAVLKDGNREFHNDREATIQIAMSESMVYTRLDRRDKAKEAIDRAVSIARSQPRKGSANIDVDLAKALILNGDAETGRDILRRLIQNNHEDTEVLDQVKQAFRNLGMEDEGQNLVDTAVDEVITMNNEGARLVREGDLVKAIKYFQKATEILPDNKIINANAAYAHILYMQENKPDTAYLIKVRVYLDRVTRLDKNYKDLPKLRSMYKMLMLG